MNSLTLLAAAALLVPLGDARCPTQRACSLGHPAIHVCELSPISTIEQRLLSDASDGALDEFSLLNAALLAGGTTGSKSRALSREFALQCDRFVRSGQQLTQRELAQAIFEALYANVLTGRYQARCSDCAVAIEHGDYNCVTATVLYVEALRRYGIPAKPFAMVGHVFCRVGDAPFDVETTCPRWFCLSHDEAHIAAAQAARGRAQARATARQLSDVQLIGKIYYNRGVACFRQNKFEKGMQLTRRSLMLDHHDTVARGNVLAGLNNWGLHLCERSNFKAAEEKFEQLRQLDPKYPTLSENKSHLYRMWGKERIEPARGTEDERSPSVTTAEGEDAEGRRTNSS